MPCCDSASSNPTSQSPDASHGPKIQQGTHEDPSHIPTETNWLFQNQAKTLQNNHTRPLDTDIQREIHDHNQEESIKDKEKDDSDIRIYTDSLRYEGKVGAAAVLYRKGANELEKILHYYLGPLTKHTTFEGEAVGSILTAWMMQGQTEVGKLMMTSHTYSQAFIKSTGARKAGPGQYFVMEYLRLAKVMNDKTNAPIPTDTDKFTLK